MKLNLIQNKINTEIEIEIIIVKHKNIKTNKKVLQQLNFTGEDESCVLLIAQKKTFCRL